MESSELSLVIELVEQDFLVQFIATDQRKGETGEAVVNQSGWSDWYNWQLSCEC